MLFRLWRDDVCEKEEVLLKSSKPAELAAKIAQAERGLLEDEEGEEDEDYDDEDDDDYDDDEDDRPRRRGR
jgi:twitching motility protein PilT